MEHYGDQLDLPEDFGAVAADFAHKCSHMNCKGEWYIQKEYMKIVDPINSDQ